MVTLFKNTATQRTATQPIVDICFVYEVSVDMAEVPQQFLPQQFLPQQFLQKQFPPQQYLNR